MQKFWLFFLLFGLTSCQQTPAGSADEKKSGATTKSGYTFDFSPRKFGADFKDPANWCNIPLGEAALISADPQKYQRRLFALGEVPIRIIIDYGHQTATAAFMLQKEGNKVHLFTSDNLPTCLSGGTSFRINDDGLSFRYDNSRNIHFDVYLQELPGGIQIALELPEGGNHGLAVLRCDACK